MQINVSFDASTATAPAGYFAAVNYAASLIDALIADNVTVAIDFGWGEVNGQALSANSLGQSVSNGYVYSYGALARALSRDATSADDRAAVASLPGADPSHGAGMVVAVAQQLALGLGGAGSAPVAGYVGLSPGDSYTFDPDHRSVAGAYDAVGVLLHEITEVLGRTSNVDDTSGRLNVLDLFRYSASGVHTTADAGGWFSVDGSHLLAPFNNPANDADAGDWASSQAGDAFAENSGSGREQLISTTDLRVLDVIGYHLASGTAVDGAPLPVVYELDGTAADESLSGTASADYIRGMAGNDTIDGGAGDDIINGNQGDDLIHGGAGDDTVYGGQGDDTLYGDAGRSLLSGNKGGDVLYAGANGDTLYGGQGDDRLVGGDGADVLSGDLGNDTLSGSKGADTFAFRPGGGHDVVTDFNGAEGDRIQLPIGAVFTLASVDGHVVVDLATGDTLSLLGVAQISPDWIVFA